MQFSWKSRQSPNKNQEIGTVISTNNGFQIDHSSKHGSDNFPPEIILMIKREYLITYPLNDGVEELCLRWSVVLPRSTILVITKI